MKIYDINTEAVVRRCSSKKVFLKNSQISRESTNRTPPVATSVNILNCFLSEVFLTRTGDDLFEIMMSYLRNAALKKPKHSSRIMFLSYFVAP